MILLVLLVVYKGAFVASNRMQVSPVRQHKHGNGCNRIYFLVRLTARSLPSVFLTVSARVVLRCRGAAFLAGDFFFAGDFLTAVAFLADFLAAFFGGMPPSPMLLIANSFLLSNLLSSSCARGKVEKFQIFCVFVKESP